MNEPTYATGALLDINLLLVEDVPMNARIVEQMLTTSTRCRYHCEWRRTLAEALELLRSRDFDTVLLDLNLPDSSDLATLTRVFEVGRGVPVVVLTATDNERTGLLAVQAGAQDYLVKGQCKAVELDRSIVYSIERHRLQHALRQLAVLDELTGLYNRRGFNSLNAELFQQLRRGPAHGYLACFDLDHFKEINDTHGHAAGDAALVEFASFLRGAFRKQGLFARIGGDEFVAMGIEPHAGAAAEAVAALNHALEARNAARLTPFALEASAGLLLFDQTERRPLAELLQQADARLYAEKLARRSGQPPDPSLPEEPAALPARPEVPRFERPELEVLHRLRAVCEQYDPTLGRHHERVAALSAAIARRLELDPELVAQVEQAAGIHDLGKIGVPRTILHRTGRLGAKDLAAIRAHTEIGHRLLEGSEWPEIRCAAEVALSHHEHWDGDGYPQRRRGEAIPLAARIVAVADVFDAMRSARAYKGAWAEPRVLEEMTKGRGTQFDPRVFDAFLDLLRECRELPDSPLVAIGAI